MCMFICVCVCRAYVHVCVLCVRGLCGCVGMSEWCGNYMIQVVLRLMKEAYEASTEKKEAEKRG